MSEQPASLRLIGLSKRYRTGDQALNEVSLSVPPGQVLGLIGPSGAGKSTLIRCINRLVEPSAGQVFLSRQATPGKAPGAGRSTATGVVGSDGAAGSDVDHLRTDADAELHAGTESALEPGPSGSDCNDIELTGLGRRGLRQARRRIGMIFQEFALVERLTVMENVLSGRLGYLPFWRSWLRRFPPADIANAYRLLDRVGLVDQANKRADALSGGQRQRVGIARALAQEPDLLLVDEPTASLDPKTSRQIMRLLREVCAERGLAAIVNIHDVALAQQFMMRIVGLRAGRIVYDGPPDGLTPAVLTQIYGEEDWTSAAGDADETGARDRTPGGTGGKGADANQGPPPPTDQGIAQAL
ncbi:MAG: phosphonate ABC transporter ATP-binding protein [Halochromatium sp.]|uniref:phosphonate ABC transporter ATP-binding protein n=1 Tax=Halochromatium sp. TaxID=2049430 RepID=UPI00397AAF07